MGKERENVELEGGGGTLLVGGTQSSSLLSLRSARAREERKFSVCPSERVRDERKQRRTYIVVGNAAEDTERGKRKTDLERDGLV